MMHLILSSRNTLLAYFVLITTFLPVIAIYSIDTKYPPKIWCDPSCLGDGQNATDRPVPPKFAPYIDITLIGPNIDDLQTIMNKTGQKDFALGFALGAPTPDPVLGTKCVPTWGGLYPLDNPTILAKIHLVVAAGGKVILSSGGANGAKIAEYLENVCSEDELVQVYKDALDIVGTSHLDIDVEAEIPYQTMNAALARLQAERPNVTLSFTHVILGQNQGIVPGTWGILLLRDALRSGVRVDIVNAMTMEYPNVNVTWGECIIATAFSVHLQMIQIWTEEGLEVTDEGLWGMLGVIPMLGVNFNNNTFYPDDARNLVSWANQHGVGRLGFWSIARDKGCPDSPLSPTCSSIDQTDYEFTKIFQGFTGK